MRDCEHGSLARVCEVCRLTAEKDKALGAARMLRAALAALPGDPEEADALAATAWLDESEGT